MFKSLKRAMSIGACLTMVATSAQAFTFTEVGDAGQLVGDAQLILGPQGHPLGGIDGTLQDVNDVDLYGIFIPDPSVFTAQITSSDFDTELFLFDANGFGVIANDDDGVIFAPSRLPAFSGPAGDYLLAISSFPNDPRSIDGLIFLNNFPGLEIANGPGGASPLIDWETVGEGAGAYSISLTGADTRVQVSEPASLALMAAGLGLLGLRRRKA